MKRKGISLLCILLCLIILKINVRFSNAQEKVNLIDEILLQTKSKTVEYGLNTYFETFENPKEICSYLIQNLGLNNSGTNLKQIENEDSYCIEFSGENVKGYIESTKYNNKDVITINISKIGNENGLESLKDMVRNCIGSRGENVKYFQHLKSKISESTAFVGIDDINARIINILKSHGTENIETVKINNGLSTIAYTGKYDEKVTNNKLTDFNYAICNYSSGRYIIIGTPEIITTY